MFNHVQNDSAVGSRRRRSTKWKGLGVALTAGAFFVMSALPAWAAEMMTVTFVRHGQSYGNLSGLIDTSTPGPVLTPLGQQQARNIVSVLGDNNYDAIYASAMVRTQQTATPMSQYLGLPIQVLPGLQEIEAGNYEGTPEANSLQGYLVAPIQWLTGQGQGINARIPGSIDGNEFESRVNGALQTIYDNGDRNPIVFSHGGTIMFWTMMNVDNLSLSDKLALFATHPLTNTSYVVVEGNPEDGWTLVNWDGKQISPEKTFGAVVQIQVRTLSRQLAAAGQQVTDALATGDLTQIATAINHSVADASFSFTKFNRAVNAEVIKQVNEAVDNIKTALTPKTADATSPAATSSVSAAATQVSAAAAPATSMLKQLSAPVAAAQTPSDSAGTVKSQVQEQVSEVATKVEKTKTDLTKAVETTVDAANTDTATADAARADATKSAKADGDKANGTRQQSRKALHGAADRVAAATKSADSGASITKKSQNSGTSSPAGKRAGKAAAHAAAGAGSAS
jgi:broad specificity phosphatase PhoE